MPKFAALHREGRGIIRRVRDSTTGCGALDSEAKTNSNAPTIVPRPDHCISRSQISRNCLKVLYRLKEAGYQAFLVGGGVRDLLLGREPKDFDVVTDAWPEDVRKLFRNCRLIGRRFRLAHVYFGREVIEVATFRAAQEDADVDDEAGELVRDDGGRIIRDNRYGTIDEDVWRRDFTANALYYNIADFSIWDYTTGVADVDARVMRLIGDPEARYREDPVRLLRGVRLAAKLEFTFSPETEAPIAGLAPLLEDVPPARLFDESLKLFLAGHGIRSFEMLRHYGLFRYLFPMTDAALDGVNGEQVEALVRRGLENTDQRVTEGKPVTPMFLFAVFLWHPVTARAEALQEAGNTPMQALSTACDEIARDQQAAVSIPRRITTPMKDIQMMQPRLTRTRGKRVLKVLDHPRFRAAYDLLLLRTDVGDASRELADFWTQIQNETPGDREQVVAQPKAPGRRRRRRRPRKASGDTGGQ